jgi:hypothetical protein
MVKKVRWAVKSADLDNVEEDDFEPYDGPTPPKGVYQARIKSAKLTESSNGNNMIKVLLIVDGKASGKPKYDGAPIWDNVVDTPQTAFRVKQFLKGIDATMKDWDRTTCDDEGGSLKIGRVRPEGLLVRISTKLEEYEGDHNAKIDRYLPPKDEEPEEEYDEEDEDDVADVEYDEEEEGDEEEEVDEDEDDDADEEPAPAPRRAAKKAAPPATPARKAAAKKAPAKRASARRRNDDEEPPF